MRRAGFRYDGASRAEPDIVEASLEGTIERLSAYWSGQGCLRLPPCEYEMPAALMHSETFFRLLASAPWRGQVLQPVRRPLDGRLGRHPFRLARHLQLDVVLVPPPADVQALVQASLAALGIAPREHDLRYREWNWAATSLDVWSLGWQVELDGIGIARVSFLQRLAGRDLEPVAVEIAYGVERLAMAVGGATSVFAIPFSDAGAASYGRLRGQSEEELSRYATEVADPEYLFRVLDGLEEESASCCRAGLARVAYELAVKCLWRIDLLTARDELSSRERDHHLERVRALVVAAAEAHRKRQPAVAATDPAVAPLAEEAAEPGPPVGDVEPAPPPAAPEPAPEPVPELVTEPVASPAPAARPRRRKKRASRRGKGDA